MWSDPAVSIAQRSSEDAVARAKLEDYVRVGIPSTGDRKKSFVLLANEQIMTLSSDEEEIDPAQARPTMSLRR